MTKKISFNPSILSDGFFYVACVVLGVAASNIFSLQGYLLLICFFLFAFSALLNGGFQFNSRFIVLILFCVSYACFYFLAGEGKTISDLFYIVFYSCCLPLSIAICIFQRSRDLISKRFLVWSLCIGLAVGAWLLVLATYLYAGNDLDSIMVGFWNDTPIARTGIQVYMIPLFALSFSYFINNRVRRLSFLWITVFLFLILYDLFVVYFSLEIGNRAIFIAFGAVIVLFLIKIINKIHDKKIRFFALSVFLILGVLIIGMFFGLIPIPSFLANIPTIKRFLDGGSNDQRFKLYVQFFNNCLQYPLGGTFHAIEDRFVHNFFLDIYNFAGIIPFLLFGGLLVMYISGISKPMPYYCLRSENVFLFVGLFVLGMFEPLFQANMFSISVFCVLFEEVFANYDVFRLKKLIYRRYRL